MAISIRTSSWAANTPAYLLIAEGWNALVQDNLIAEDCGICPVAPKDRVIYAENDDEEIVGVLTHRGIEDGFAISFVYVEASSRRTGVFRAMMKALSEECQRLGADHLRIEVDADNKAMREALHHLDMVPTSVVYDLYTET